MKMRVGVRLRRGFGTVRAALAALAAAGLVWAALWLPAGARANHEAHCWLVGDDTHVLTRVNKADFNPATNETTLGSTGTAKTDALAAQPRTGVLFAVNTLMYADEGYLGTLNTTTGAFSPRGQAFGTGSGDLGSVTFFDVSGLAFDPATGVLYAVHVRTGQGAADALFQVDPNTGAHVNNAFGSGDDYVPVGPHPDYPHLFDVDDLAFDPTDGSLYGIINNSNTGDRLIKINKQTGAITDVGPLGVGEVEGLAFDAHGGLWATAGGAPVGDPANRLYAVNKATGAASDPRPLDDSGNYEAIACLLAAPDVTLAVSTGGSAWPGGGLAYTLSYGNLGNQAAAGTRLVATLPDHTTFSPGSSSPGWQPGAAPGAYELALGSLAGGASSSAVFGVSIDPSLPGHVDAIDFQAAIGHDGTAGADLNPTDNTGSVSTPLIAAEDVLQLFLPTIVRAAAP